VLYEYKSVLDKHFQANWMRSPIQYDGIRFEPPDSMKWISLKFVPAARESLSLAGLKRDTATLQVLCYDTSVTKAYQLAAEVGKQFECTQVQDCYIKEAVPDGEGAIPLHNGIYETTVTFEVELLSNSKGC